jgi:hypothetical protein
LQRERAYVARLGSNTRSSLKGMAPTLGKVEASAIEWWARQIPFRSNIE